MRHSTEGRRSGRRLVHGGVLALALLTAGCETYYYDIPSPDDALHLVPWFDAMITQPAVYPYQSNDVPRDTPAGTVPVTGGERDWSAEWATGNTATADRLANPLAGQVVPAGDTLYQNFCAVCHGTSGAGNGPVAHLVGAPSLLTERARGYTDGYLYSIVRYGRGVMPRYGDKVFGERRWAVVNHVRQLQAAAPAPAGGTQ